MLKYFWTYKFWFIIVMSIWKNKLETKNKMKNEKLKWKNKMKNEKLEWKIKWKMKIKMKK